MESFIKLDNSVKATELLFFERAEIDAIKGDATSFASVGSLSLLYFSDYSRYVLQLNDWRYPLLRRLPILGDKDEMGNRTYLLPGLNGFFYRLRIEGASNEAIGNLETIFSNNSGFSTKGQDSSFRKIETSPDDKLVRTVKKDSSFMNTASETLKQVTGKAKIAVSTLKTGTKGIDSRKRMVNLKDIKNKDFKKEARSTFRKDFFTSTEKLTNDFMRLRRENANLTTLKDFKELAKVAGPMFYLPREDIEESILNNKDLASKGNFNMSMTMPEVKRMGFTDSVKQGLTDLKKGLTETRERRPEPQIEKVAGIEGMTHYQG